MADRHQVRVFTTADHPQTDDRPAYECLDDLYTISAAAQRIRVRRATIRSWIHRGLLTYRQREGDHAKYVQLRELQAAFRSQITARAIRPRDEAGRFTRWT
jgi:hypothetical protein